MSELKLTDREWRDFKINEIFETFTGALLDKKFVEEGNIPRVTATDLDNGISFFTSSIHHKNFRTFENFISISFLGSVFYQNNLASLDMKIHGIKPKTTELNVYSAKFLIPLIKNFTFKYRYGYQLSGSVLRTQKVMLPIDKNDYPDWQFMEDYIKQIELRQRKEINNYYNSLINKEIDSGGVAANLKRVAWSNFFVKDIFNFIKKPSKGLNHLTPYEHGINYVGATNRNNGVLAAVKREEKRIYDGNAIVFIRNGEGSMGYSVYKQEKFIATQDVSVGYNSNLNRYNGLFITVIADRVRGKYNFGYKRNQPRLNKEVLTLPVDKDGKPNWQFMENYIKHIEAKKLAAYYVFNEREIKSGAFLASAQAV